ncbi:APC family permease [Chondrinema litorale]|uniref:APC family permease n=1 Tax=Chondrinema litorale TaxID=2994555 RepID=UPI0025427958|nr:APC family permease [Chondrinema litorale]UZR98002.1 APC family permease [Chondrinema litorale]
MEGNTIHKNQPGLKKAIGKTAFFSLAFGSMIGVGWVTAMGSWLNDAGPIGAALAFALGGSLMLLIGFCYAEVTSMLPLAGGEVSYAYKAYGTQKSFIIGWFLAFGYLSVSAFEAISVGKVMSYLFPSIEFLPLYQIGNDTVFTSHILLALLCTGLITWLNHKGVGNAAKFQIWLTSAILLAAILLMIAGFSSGEFKNLEPVFGNRDIPWKGFLAVLVTVPFWFVGFDTIPQSAEEAQSNISPKVLGSLILLSIIAATTFYFILIVSTGMVAPWNNIVDASLPTAAAFKQAFAGSWIAKLVLITALIGLLSSWNGFFLACSRVIFALGRGRIIPATFGKTHPVYGTPTKAILFCGIITFLSVFTGRQAMVAFVDVGSFCMTVAFLGVSFSLISLRKKFPKMRRPYKLKYGLTIAYASAIVAISILLLMLIPASPVSLVWPIEWIILGFVCISGILFWITGKKSRNSIDKTQRDQQILEDFK